MFSLLKPFAELVLPSIFVMAEKPDQIPPDFYLNSLLTPTGNRDVSFSGGKSAFYLTHLNNQLVDSMYNESLLLSDSSLLFIGYQVGVNNPIIQTFYAHIFPKRNLFATKCDTDVITVQKFTSGQCV